MGGIYINTNQDKLGECLRNEFKGAEKKLKELAENNKISSDCNAFSFDVISKQICNKGLKVNSCDVLLVSHSKLLFIEFKTGCVARNNSVAEKLFLENIKLKIRLKAYESIALFEKVIIPRLVENYSLKFCSESEFKCFWAVIDSEKNSRRAVNDIWLAKSGLNDKSFKTKMFNEMKNSLAVYRKGFDDNYIFYNAVDVCYDYEVDHKLVKDKFC